MRQSAIGTQHPLSGSRLADVIAEWEQDKVRRGACKLRSAQHQASRLHLFLRPQLDVFTQTALGHFEEQNDPLALGALLALTMGLRTSEVMNRVVRDLDDGGRYLWIDEGKTASARRHLEVPAVLVPFLLLKSC